MWSAGQGDDKERFLADLRALRDTAALGYDELAARAHYPSGILKEAENGPSLPGLPILAAYVRACEGDVPEWEERWRRLGYEAWADPRLPVRPAGASPAAVAGARAGIGIAPPDVYDPERIRAALRGQRAVQTETAAAARGRTDPDAAAAAAKEAQATDGSAWKAGPQRGTGTSWETAADRAGTSANGDHHTGHRSDAPFDTSVSGTAGHAGSPGSIRHDPFSAAWLQDSDPRPSRTGNEPGRSDRADDDPPARQDSWFTPPSPPGSERTWRPTDPGLTPPDPAERGLIPRQEDGGPTPAGRADLRASSAASADVQRPGPPPPPVEGQPIPRASRPAPAETSPEGAPGLGHRAAPDLQRRAGPDRPSAAVPDLLHGPGADVPPQDGDHHLPQAAGSAVPAQSRLPTEPAVPQTTAAAPGERPDRFYALRLLTVIVVAALIGSILVLLIR